MPIAESVKTDAGKTANPSRGPRAVKKLKKNVPHAIVHISAGYNNTTITITDPEGNVIARSSAGQVGFKGSRKGTPFAGQMATRAALEKAKAYGVRTADVWIKKNLGPGWDAAAKEINNSGVFVRTFLEMIANPHNGNRAKKERRV